MKDTSDKNEKKSGIGPVIVLIVIIALLIAFLVSKDTIMTVLKDTEFFTHVFGTEPEFVENYEIPERLQKKETANTIILTPQEQLAETHGIEDTDFQETTKIEPVKIIEEKPEVKKTQTEIEMPKTEKPATEEPKIEKEPVKLPPVEVAKADQHLYFVVINADGTVTRKETVRSVPKTITPLSAALKGLLNGPTPEEREDGYLSFIPEGTQLLSVSIQHETAMINFSEDFSFNQYGIEGYLAQLMQVIYTATTFNTIKNVQFLIEGEQTSYLGSDGVWIGSPLSRTDCK